MAFTISTSYAQEFSFKTPSPSPTFTSPSASMLPKRDPALSAQGFANSSANAYQAQQAKVSSMVEKQQAKAMQDKAAASGTIQKPEMIQKPGTEPPKTFIQDNTTPRATPQPVATSPATSAPQATQPYTGFQSSPPSNTGGSGSSPNTNQNSGGWGTSIKY